MQVLSIGVSIEYIELPLLGLDAALREAGRRGKLKWPEFAPRYMALLAERRWNEGRQSRSMRAQALLCPT